MERSHDASKVTPIVVLIITGIFILVAMVGSLMTNKQSRRIDRSFAQVPAHATRTPTPTVFRTTPTSICGRCTEKTKYIIYCSQTNPGRSCSGTQTVRTCVNSGCNGTSNSYSCGSYGTTDACDDGNYCEDNNDCEPGERCQIDSTAPGNYCVPR